METESNKCFILTNCGKVFLFNSDKNEILFEIIVGLKVNHIYSYSCQTEQGIYFMDDENENSIELN